MILLGEAYAFGVVWSFVFKTLSMVVLRFKERGPREFVVPFNIRMAAMYVPIGLAFVFLIVFLSALANLVTKPVATISGLIFTAAFLRCLRRHGSYSPKTPRHGAHHEHMSSSIATDGPAGDRRDLGLTRPYCKLVAIRSPHNLFMLDKALADTDPQTTDVVVMTAKSRTARRRVAGCFTDCRYLRSTASHGSGQSRGEVREDSHSTFSADEQRATCCLEHSERPPCQEMLIGASNKYTAEEQLDQIAFYWINLHGGMPQGLTVHVVSQDRDLTFDLDGGNRIPKAAERRARSVAELREAGIGVRRVLLAHDGTRASSDVFEWLLTMLSSSVELGCRSSVATGCRPLANGHDTLEKDRQWAEQLGRTLKVIAEDLQTGPEIVRISRKGGYDAIVLPALSASEHPLAAAADWPIYILHHARCSVFIAVHPTIPREIVG